MGVRIVPVKPARSPIPSAKATEALLKATVNDLLDSARADYGKTVNTWTRKPTFALSKAARKGSTLTGSVITDNVIYGYVDEGTKPHVIRPKRAGGVLAFRGSYSAKTRVGVIGSTAGGASGALIRAQQVNHPGTKARGFTERIIVRLRKRAPLLFMRALAKSINDV